MKIEELTPLKELAFNYVKNTLKKDIKLEDIYSIVSYVYGVRIQFNFYVEKQDVFINEILSILSAETHCPWAVGGAL